MSISIQIPEELYHQARRIAEAQHVSVDEIFAGAFLEHLAALERFKQRAARGSREGLLEMLDQVPDVEPEEADRL